MDKERKGSLEKLARISKGVDVASAAFGLIIGGETGLAIILVSGATYYLADRLEKRKRSS
jgi:hypothetical protein